MVAFEGINIAFLWKSYVHCTFLLTIENRNSGVSG